MLLHTTGLLLVKNRKLLLAFSNNKQCYYLPGGKIDTGETARQALCREIEEELNVLLTENELEFYTHITAPAFGETTGIIMEQDCFFINRPVEVLYPSAEIGAVKYFTLSEYLQEERQAPGAVMILQQLVDDQYIDL
ncbi:MAG: NUDIX domain-containing protein [Ferruginibacter sp.]